MHLMSNTDEGKELEKTYAVKGHPSFVLTNASGEVIDRWVGYRNPQSFVAQLSAGIADPTTADEKRARYLLAPTVTDAATLGRISASRGERAEALAYYRRAAELDPAGPYREPIFENLAALHGQEGTKLTTKEIVEAADAALASSHVTTETKVATAFRMLEVGKRAKDPKIAAPYIEAALEATSGLVRSRERLLVEQAMHVEGDGELAVRLQRETMPDGWMQDPAKLNEFAWWSFENRVNLVEAEALALKGVELSEPGAERAQILDTAAELAALRGDRAEAASLIRRAAQDDPGEEHYRKQLERFEKGESPK